MPILTTPFRWDYKPPLGSELDRDHPQSKGLVGCWLFHEGAGPPRDIAGNSTSTMTSGPTWTTGDDGRVLVFTTATSGNVTVTGVPAIGPAMTIIVRFKWDGVSVNFGMFVERENVNATWALFAQSSTIIWRGGAITNRCSASFAAAGIVANTWTTLAIADSGGTTTGLSSMAINGLPVGTFDPAAAAPVANRNPIHFGNYDNAGLFLGAQLGGIWLYDRCLSPEQLLRHSVDPYAQILPPPSRRLIPYSGIAPPVTLFRRTLSDRTGSRGVA